MPSDQAIVSLVVGDRCCDFWGRYCAVSWFRYAQQHGYDLVILDRLIDDSPGGRARSPAWQKCLILGHEEVRSYRRVVWLDADVVINVDAAPSIAAQVPPECIGGVISCDYILDDLKVVYLERMNGIPVSYRPDPGVWERHMRKGYGFEGFREPLADMVQTGVLVLAPQHRELLERVYHHPPPRVAATQEQLSLSRAVLLDGRFFRLNSRFNTVFRERAHVHYPYLFRSDCPQRELLGAQAVATELANSYFLHFAAAAEFAQFLATPAPCGNTAGSPTG